ncbi:MAG: FeoB-associated Cys-rich membrane protein [Eubacteriales bacterium]
MDFVVGGIICLILFLATSYLWKEKKKGSICPGCSACTGTCPSMKEEETE